MRKGNNGLENNTWPCLGSFCCVCVWPFIYESSPTIWTEQCLSKYLVSYVACLCMFERRKLCIPLSLTKWPSSNTLFRFQPGTSSKQSSCNGLNKFTHNGMLARREDSWSMWAVMGEESVGDNVERWDRDGPKAWEGNVKSLLSLRGLSLSVNQRDEG